MSEGTHEEKFCNSLKILLSNLDEDKIPDTTVYSDQDIYRKINCFDFLRVSEAGPLIV